MSFLHGHVSYDGDDENTQRRGSRLLGSLSKFGRRRSSLSLRRHEQHDDEHAAGVDAERAPSPGTDTEHEEEADDAASTYSTDDESVVFTDDGGDDDDEADDEDFDVGTLKNTLYNAHSLGCYTSDGYDPAAMTNYEDEDLLDPAADEFQTAPNIVFSRNEKELESQRNLYVASDLPVSVPGRPKLVTKGPLFARNRCTVMMEYGDYRTAAQQTARPKRYVVASDGSEGSQYAINWAMGTVLRDGDETLIVSVMETETKLDFSEEHHHFELNRSTARQRMRQDMAVLLAHQAFVLLQRTQLAVRVSCQAVHARNARHMLLSLIDFYSPTMVIVGSRGIETIRGVLGSMSHYLVQKSSVPVMVAHNKLQLPRLPRGKADVVNNVRMRHMRLDQASTEKQSNATDHDHDDDDDDKNTLTEEQVAERNAEREAERKSKESERMNRLNRKSLERRKDSTGKDATANSPARAPESPAPDPASGLAPAIEKLTTDGTQTTLHFAQ
ncbi:hypothetical protein MBRA1_003524 [Malassezia brasiliensis]|uniref:UspA domain-containing protein n=1 Tax=Malassezia brasiliensis TaxID=1821822 RepID=A0AAF0DW30_9BASI|nr:hypothetical protein MBRA1_003524 [Malassezia brasiliensis]